MMNRKEFFEYVKDHVKDYLPGDYADTELQLQEVVKKNGMDLTAIVIPVSGSNITPKVYLDPFYQEYGNGKDVDACVADVADLWAERKQPELDMDLNDVLDYAKIKEMLQVRLCDLEENREWLDGKAMTVQGDFAAYYTILLSEGGENKASLIVDEQLLEGWGIDLSTLHQDAMEADLHRGAVLNSIDELMASLIFDAGEAENLLESEQTADMFFSPMFCMSNEEKKNGAALILHEDIRKQIGAFMKGDYYILPASVHEVMLVPDNGRFSVQQLQDMVRDINETELLPDERLSGKVQFCDGRTAVMENARERENRMAKEKNASVEKGIASAGLHGKMEKARAQAKEQNRNGAVDRKTQSRSQNTAMEM